MSMLATIQPEEATMTLKEITDLLEVRHNDAMKIVTKMAESEGFGATTKISYMVEIGSGAKRSIQTYELNRRQSMAVSARLNTALLMKVIDRLDELEKQLSQPKALSYDEIIHQALSMADEKVKALTLQVDDLKPKAETLDRIATADGSMNITNAAKHLQVRPKVLFDTLSAKKWIYRRAGGAGWIGYQDKIQQGLLEHKVTIQIIEGVEKIREQVRITTKGILKISTTFPQVSDEVEA